MNSGTVGGKHALQYKPSGALVLLQLLVVGQGQIVSQLGKVNAFRVLLAPLANLWNGIHDPMIRERRER